MKHLLGKSNINYVDINRTYSGVLWMRVCDVRVENLQLIKWISVYQNQYHNSLFGSGAIPHPNLQLFLHCIFDG